MPNVNAPTPPPGRRRALLFRNWISLAGLVLALGSLFSFLLLFVLNAIANVGNPYLGVLTYLVAPAFLILGLILVGAGALWYRRRLKAAGPVPALQIDLSRARDRRNLAFFVAGSVGFLLVSALGSYKTYQFTESVQFCGETCHRVMKPEFTTYENGSHARVACAECHIGPGATWFVRSKLSGTYQVYATLFNKFPRPILTPVKNLRPAQETCEQCHWPRKFVGNLDRTYRYFLGDRTNTPYTLRLLLKVGGGDPTHGPMEGIHWHMSVINRIEYIATDPGRQKIPWVRLTNPLGVVTVYRAPDFTNDIAGYQIRVVDCMDCHNRPSHRFGPPQFTVDLALALHQLDPALPYIKTNAVFALTRPYSSDTDAKDKIASFLAKQYPPGPALNQAIVTVQTIYTNNFFPVMKASWSVYPDNIGHMIWPGCFRCHDGNHKTADGKQTIANTCNTCHTILAQGRGPELLKLSAAGQPFDHPGGEIDPGFQCTDCHTGGP
jgi:NapC/NirT cytochrome c family, N-terminal region